MKKLLLCSLHFFLCAFILKAQTEPSAGKWKTWFISSGKDYRLAPPTPAEKEITTVLEAQKNIDSATLQQIIYWSQGAPSYHWQQLMAGTWMNDALGNGILANMLMSVSIYDATVAAWDTKYAYNRVRPFAADKRIKRFVLNPESPSYPCEHAVTAGAAATIIAHFFPLLKDSVNKMAQQQMASRIAAGVAFADDTRAGFELGQKIASEEIERTKNFLDKTTWDGKVPEGPGRWHGQFAMLPGAGKSKTVVLQSGSQFRPAAPPDFSKDMDELKNYKQTFDSKANAFYYASHSSFDDIIHTKIFEYNLHLNAPGAARVYAIEAIGYYDGFVACWDAKYAYWGIRPNQYDSTYKPLLPTPPFPGYPSGHAMVSCITAELCAYLFPADKDFFRARAKEVAESRFQAGIHFRTDNEVALDMGKKAGAWIVEKLKKDGAGEATPVISATDLGKKK